MRLYIYDEQEYRHSRHDADDGIVFGGDRDDTVRLPASSLTGLQGGLDQLVKDKKTFDRVLWMTHGSPGGIYFGDDFLGVKALAGDGFAGKGYGKLFPKPTKMYFSGCNVAGDTDCSGSCSPEARDIGWRFLEAAGKLFLQGGGYTMGWTSLGHGWNQKIIRMLVSSHSVHFSGDVRHVTFGPGGKVLERLSYDGGFVHNQLTMNFERFMVQAKLSQAMAD
jgi:hypothetical protein